MWLMLNDDNAIIFEDLKSFAIEIESLCKDTRTDLASFPSGAIMLDVFCKDRFFVLVYSPSAGFGVDEVTNDDSLGTSYKFHLPTLDMAKAKLKLLMKDFI
jgi:hypothetical protein